LKKSLLPPKSTQNKFMLFYVCLCVCVCVFRWQLWSAASGINSDKNKKH
jgi:hypothetical protein